MKNSFRGSVGRRISWTRWSLTAVAAAALSVGLPSIAQAATSPDAAVTQLGPNDTTITSQTMAQTVKAQHAGQLYQVDLHYGNQWFASAVKVQIWSVTSQGVPLAAMPSAVLAVANVPFTTDWHAYTLPARISVQAGQAYAIVLSSGVASSNRWSYNAGAGYADGKMFNLARGTWGAFSFGAGAAFLFRTWVDTGPQLPSITPDHTGGALADEATHPTMTGTYTNPAGGAVQLAVDHGQVTDQGAGKWSWTGDVYDENSAPASITVTLTDSLGRTASTTFALTISGVKPTARIGTSGVQAAASTTTTGLSNPEGSTLTLSGSATSADPADQAGPFTYTWTATRNGLAQPPSSAASYRVTTSDEGDTWFVSLTVTDDGGMVSDPVSVTVVGSEIRPTATITSITPSDTAITFITTQETVNFAGTFTDPAPESHTYRWDFGDGTSASTENASHAYTSGGTYTVTLTVKDDEGVAGTATATVKVLSAHDALAAMVAYVQRTSLPQGLQNSLIAKLNAASDAAARGNNTAAGNQLNAFLNELEADLKTNRISAADYNALRADAHEVQAALGTFNRFLEWWPLPA